MKKCSSEMHQFELADPVLQSNDSTQSSLLTPLENAFKIQSLWVLCLLDIAEFSLVRKYNEFLVSFMF